MSLRNSLANNINKTVRNNSTFKKIPTVYSKWFLISVAIFTIYPPKYWLTIKCILICCNIDFHELFRRFLPEQGEQVFPNDMWFLNSCY